MQFSLQFVFTLSFHRHTQFCRLVHRHILSQARCLGMYKFNMTTLAHYKHILIFTVASVWLVDATTNALAVRKLSTHHRWHFHPVPMPHLLVVMAIILRPVSRLTIRVSFPLHSCSGLPLFEAR